MKIKKHKSLNSVKNLSQKSTCRSEFAFVFVILSFLSVVLGVEPAYAEQDNSLLQTADGVTGLQTQIEAQKKSLESYEAENQILKSQRDKDKKYIEELKKALKASQGLSESRDQKLKEMAGVVSKGEAAKVEITKLRAEVSTLIEEKKVLSEKHEALKGQKEKVSEIDHELKSIRDQDVQKTTVSIQNANSLLEQQRKENATVHYNMATLLMQQGRHQEAAKEFEYVLKSDDSHGFAHFNLALINDRHLNKPMVAVDHYAAYVRLFPHAVDVKDVEFRIFQLRLNKEKGIGHDLTTDKF